MSNPSLDDALEIVSVLPPGAWENEIGPRDWYAICDSSGIVAYAGTETLALHIRLHLVNLIINPYRAADGFTAPDTIHDYPVIEQRPTPKAPATRAGRVVLVDRGVARDNGHHRWVTAWQGRDESGRWDSEWCHGHYFNDEKEARDDYNYRCQRDRRHGGI